MNQFQGLTDLQWKVLELIPKKEKRGKGKPHTPWINPGALRRIW